MSAALSFHANTFEDVANYIAGLVTPGLQRLQHATRTKNRKRFGRAPLCQGSPRQDGKSDGVIIIWQAHCVERGSLSSAQIMMGYYGMAEAGGGKRVIGRER